ncbi:N-6 DNA methylase [Anaerolineales bacterium HSG24]|nr:N-6 DNA methylase [Anaerolineales bacterium HSG24]
MTIQGYLNAVNKKFRSGISREHSYRADLENLIRELVKGVEIINEPANVTDCGNPDYVITKGKIPIGYIEAKDIGKDLNSKQYKEQFTRYKKALNNLIITDYIWFQFFQNGKLVHEIKIGAIENGTVKSLTENFAEFESLIQNFCTFIGQTIKSPKKLAEMMASKARLLQTILERAITSDEETQEDTSLKDQFASFKNILIHDLRPNEFADIYAQTLAYGMFAARLHDPTLDTFTRQEAAELIPNTNPFLRKLFQHVAGYDIDERIKTTVDNLADVFRATNVDDLLHNFGQSTQTNDPIIHFYETFLAEYDPKLRKARGVWYTPEPVVNFIVRAVDDILKTEFGLAQGLADTSKTKIKVMTQTADKRTASGYREIEREVHKVQILDPATGTGTFLAEVVKHIYNKNFKAMQGAWSGYVEEHLVPRLNGFELLMASYAMAHLKLDMLLAETGYKPQKEQRFNIYLTNSLEEHHPDTGTLFASWLSSEANEANHIKRDTPVMVVLGNPPYAVSSSNKGEWIQNLLADYKKNLNEKKLTLDDDYIKFIRYGQYYIDRTGKGILAYISNNSFIDGVTHRQMRRCLLESFDKIYILDLHGDSKKRETAPDGTLDENVFDIMQGVSINIFIKTRKKKKGQLGEIFHFDLYGVREKKQKILFERNLKTVNWSKLSYTQPYLFFIPKNYSVEDKYNSGISVSELFANYVSGIQTKNDKLSIQHTTDELTDIINDFKNLNIEELKSRYDLKDSSGWSVGKAKNDLLNNPYEYASIYYRPFDIRKTVFTGKSGGFIGRPRFNIMRHMLKENCGLIFKRSRLLGNIRGFSHFSICKGICDLNYLSDQSYVFPLYLYPESTGQQPFLESKPERKPNLNPEIVKQIAAKISLTYIPEKENTPNTFAPIDILDYIYAVLHSPAYREKYKGFLKIDFPRVPYPKSQQIFWRLVELGGELRQIHLLESPKVEAYITQYPNDGDNTVTRKLTKTSIGFELTDSEKQTGKVWINNAQYFDSVPLIAWEFYIGGYQPAQKWLKDRKKRQLCFEDILHYQKIIVALTETDRIMKEIDGIEIE